MEVKLRRHVLHTNFITLPRTQLRCIMPLVKMFNHCAQSWTYYLDSSMDWIIIFRIFVRFIVFFKDGSAFV